VIEEQVNAVVGEHAGTLSGLTQHPARTFGGDGTRAAFVALDQASEFVLHHDICLLEMGPGIYEFWFLDGHEDKW
jgi:hypothetical protein